MKKFLSVLAVIMLIFMLSCGSEAGQVGVPSNYAVPLHSHMNAADGGTLGLVGCKYSGIDGPITTATTTIMYFGTKIFDNASILSQSTNTIFTIPSGYTFADISCTITPMGVSPASSGHVNTNILINGGNIQGGITVTSYHNFAVAGITKTNIPNIVIMQPVNTGDKISYSISNNLNVNLDTSASYCTIKLYK